MKRIVFYIALLCVASHAAAQKKMRQLFIEAPESITPALTENNRLDLVDFAEAGMTAQVANKFDGESRLLALTGDYLLMQSSSAGTLQMKLLPTANDTVQIVCMVQSVCAEACDSRVQFFTTAWEELPAHRFVALPTQSDFWLAAPQGDKSAADSLSRLQSEADLTLLHCTLSAESDSLTCRLSTPDFLGKEWSRRAAAHLRPRIAYAWDGERFVKDEEEQEQGSSAN